MFLHWYTHSTCAERFPFILRDPRGFQEECKSENIIQFVHFAESGTKAIFFDYIGVRLGGFLNSLLLLLLFVQLKIRFVGKNQFWKEKRDRRPISCFGCGLSTPKSKAYCEGTFFFNGLRMFSHLFEQVRRAMTNADKG